MVGQPQQPKGHTAPLPLSSIAGDWWLARAATSTLSRTASETVFGNETVPTAAGPVAAFDGFSSFAPFFWSFFGAGANCLSAKAAFRASLAVFLAAASAWAGPQLRGLGSKTEGQAVCGTASALGFSAFSFFFFS